MSFAPIIVNTDKPSEKPVIRLQEGVVSSFQMKIKDTYGNEYDFDGTERVTFESRVSETDGEVYISAEATVFPDSNVVLFNIPATDVTVPGWFLGQIKVETVDTSGIDPVYTPVFILAAYMEVIPLLGSTCKVRPVFINEIRDMLKDRSGADNTVTDAVEFSDAEIARAVFSTVDYWNTTVPAVSIYNATSFPYKDLYVSGVLYKLYTTAFLNLTRNRMPINAGGMSYDDKARTDMYGRLSQMYENEFKQGVAQRKNEINTKLWLGTCGRM